MMAALSSKSNMKGFYKQRKNDGGISKSKRKSTPSIAATSPTVVTSHDDDYEGKEEMLREFDMNMAYGPCLGMSRLERWERAKALGLGPPQDIEDLLNASKVRVHCLWDGCV